MEKNHIATATIDQANNTISGVLTKERSRESFGKPDDMKKKSAVRFADQVTIAGEGEGGLTGGQTTLLQTTNASFAVLADDESVSHDSKSSES